jgi:mediator of replication checkpoint protein 1
MSSSRDSSPVDESVSDCPLQLTPNSKVKALLASFEGDSDDDNVSGSARARLRTAFAKNPTSDVENTPQGDGHTNGEQDFKAVSDEGEDEEEEIIRPTGRMAARMLATEEVSEADHEQSERGKRMLKGKSKTPDHTVYEDGEESDEDGAPVIPRKRRVRTSRRGTPVSMKASPRLFLSPITRESPALQDSGSDSEDLPLNPITEDDDRFKALVARKREERRAKEAEEAEKKAKMLAERRNLTAIFHSDEDISDDQAEKTLTQSQRPTRKANKRAMEEIKRETQRMSRNMQLTHKAVTKKQFKKAGLFARFNFKVAGIQEEDDSKVSQLPDPIQPTSTNSTTHSDIEMHETPPTSPATQPSDIDKTIINATSQTYLDGTQRMVDEGDLPTLEETLAAAPARSLEKGKGKVIEEPIFKPKITKKKYSFTRRPVTAHRFETIDDDLYDSDNDLEIVGAKTPDAKRKRLNAIFDRIPAKQAKESHSLQALKMLAHLTSPGKQSLGKNKKPSITNTEMQLSLQQKARQQASREREERLQTLRDKGIIIQTAEEREKEMAEVENLIAKARREGEEIMQREKAAAKKERKANGEVDPVGDSSDDEDWEEEKENLAEVLSDSGSEDEVVVPEEGDSDANEEDADNEEEDELLLDDGVPYETNTMFDNEADETDDDEGEKNLTDEEGMLDVVNAEEEEEEDDAALVSHVTRRARKSNVISDDEDEDNSVIGTPIAPRTESPRYLHTDSPVAPNSVLRSATKTFIPGVTVAGPAGLGLTQIFAGTMDESQAEVPPTAVDSVTPGMEPKNDSMSFFKQFPVPELPPFMPTMPSMEEDSQDVVMDSQSGKEQVPESQDMESQTPAIQLAFSQSQIHGFDSLVDPMATQMSEFPDATQDIGFQHMTPIRGRFVDAPPSTVDTVILGPTIMPQAMDDTPIVKKKGKLRRRPQVAAFSDEENIDDSPVEAVSQEDDIDALANVFDVMRKASKTKKIIVDEFDKKKSEAKTMVHDQAEESEDEYAGLGGASDDESGGEADEYVKEMIDDEGGHNIDEGKLAAFFAYVNIRCALLYYTKFMKGPRASNRRKTSRETVQRYQQRNVTPETRSGLRSL